MNSPRKNQQKKLANQEDQNSNKNLVVKLYNALNKRDVDTVHQLLNPDLEWWFHGPPHHQHMMRLLTGSSPDDSFLVVPYSICTIGSIVLVEGTDLSGTVYWAHAWTVSPQGVIVQVREYFNTSLIVTKLDDKYFKPVWKSRLPDWARKSLPGLVLAI
ncbi:hypothetical protein LUZ60_003882 [Juncus effusus]|nr:hypothetical protein LUZ60_003882 [Juncus effusus]